MSSVLDTDSDITVLEDMEFDTPCDNKDDNTATWIIVLKPRPCGCDTKNIILVCEGCYKWYLEHSSMYAMCSRCMTPMNMTFGELIISIERLK